MSVCYSVRCSVITCWPHHHTFCTLPTPTRTHRFYTHTRTHTTAHTPAHTHHAAHTATLRTSHTPHTLHCTAHHTHTHTLVCARRHLLLPAMPTRIRRAAFANITFQHRTAGACRCLHSERCHAFSYPPYSYPTYHRYTYLSATTPDLRLCRANSMVRFCRG